MCRYFEDTDNATSICDFLDIQENNRKFITSLQAILDQKVSDYLQGCEWLLFRDISKH
jgi:hypothetical protein